MSRRQQSRRRHRAERRERDPAAPTPSPLPPAPPARPWLTDVSYTGLLGGLTGALPVSARAVEILATGDVSRVWAVPLFAIGAVYVPAIWVSVRPVANRRNVYRWVLVVSLVAMVIGAVAISPTLAGLLLVPSSLLAIAAGVLFSRPPRA